MKNLKRLIHQSLYLKNHRTLNYGNGFKYARNASVYIQSLCQCVLKWAIIVPVVMQLSCPDLKVT